MHFFLPAIIAGKYLLSKKSHTAVGAISSVSIIGTAVATAAILCVLSVFNGFRGVITSHLDLLAPDILIEPVSGKTIAEADSLCKEISKISGVRTATPVVSDNALIIANGQEMPVMLIGVVPDEYAQTTNIRSIVDTVRGRYLQAGIESGLPETTISIGVASQLKLFENDRMLLFAPRRNGKVNLANPITSFITDSLTVTGVYKAQQNDYDSNRILVDIATARRMFQYDKESTSIQVLSAPGTDASITAKKIADMLGPEYRVRDRMRQQEMNFRMIEIEKWVSFLLLGFILIIAGFNIISTLSMLVLEKESSLSILHSMGMSKRGIGRIFAWESTMVAGAGGISGIILGLILCLLQDKFGLIKIGDGSQTIISSYPVEVIPTDIPASLIPVVLIGLLTAVVTSAFARRRIR